MRGRSGFNRADTLADRSKDDVAGALRAPYPSRVNDRFGSRLGVGALLIALAAPLVLVDLIGGCGGRSATTDQGLDGSASGTNGDVSYGGSPGLGPSCDDAGARRDASPAEMSQYCVCTPKGEEFLVWECYGPSPSTPKPNASCPYTTVNAGNDGSCYVSWEKCSDGQVYAISCVDTYCWCLVQGIETVQLEPMQGCPEDKNTLNQLCGWELQ